MTLAKSLIEVKLDRAINLKRKVMSSFQLAEDWPNNAAISGNITLTNDMSNFKHGDRGLKISGDNATDWIGTASLDLDAVNFILPTIKSNIGVWLYSSDISEVDSIEFHIKKNNVNVNKLLDSSGNDNHATLQLTTTNVPKETHAYTAAGPSSVMPKAIRFGSNIRGVLLDDILSQQSTMSFSVWFKADSADVGMNKIFSIEGRWNARIEVDDKLRIKTGTVSKVIIGNWRDDTWHHLVVTCTGSLNKIYIDNVEKDSYAETIYNIGLNNAASAIGDDFNDSGGVNEFNGEIANLMIFSDTLTPSQVSTLWASSDGTYDKPSGTTLLAHWRLDDDIYEEDYSYVYVPNANIPMLDSTWTFISVPKHRYARRSTYGNWITKMDDATINQPELEVNAIEIEFDGNTDGCSITIGRFESVYNDKALMILCFDDAYKGAMTYGFPILKAMGVPAVVPTPPKWINEGHPDPNFPPLLVADLLEMQAAGWEICSHTFNHLSWSEAFAEGYTEDQLISELAKAKTWLENNGLYGATNIVMWPALHGPTTAAWRGTDTLIPFHTIARGVSWRTGLTSTLFKDHYTTVPLIPEDWLNVQSYKISAKPNGTLIDFNTDFIDEAQWPDTEFATYPEILDEAIADNEMICTYMHDIHISGDTFSGDSMTVEFWDDFTNYLSLKISAGLLTICTFNEWKTAVDTYLNE